MPPEETRMIVKTAAQDRVPFNAKIRYGCKGFERFVKDRSKKNVEFKCLESEDGVYEGEFEDCILSKFSNKI